MRLQDIPRVKAGASLKVSLSDLDAQDQERFSLANRARDVLGYGGLIANVAETLREPRFEGRTSQ